MKTDPLVIIKTLRLSEPEQAMLSAVSQEMGVNESEALRALIADGIKLRVNHVAAGRNLLGQQIGQSHVRFPATTQQVFHVLLDIGYRATRKTLDYCIHYAHMKRPPKVGRRMAWKIENAVDFGMELERLRYWRPGWHDKKKTAWELQSEVDHLKGETT